MSQKPNILLQSLKSCSRHFTLAFVFAAACNVLILASPLFTLQVYDRVLSSQSIPTLVVLTGIALVTFITFTLIHPWLGVMALVSCLILAMLAFLSEQLVAGNNLAGQRQLQENYHVAGNIGSRSETVMTIGMGEALLDRWWAGRRQALLAQKSGAGLAALFASLSKGVRLMVQTAMIALGAWLAVRGEITPGGMIAASIIVGRVLAPIDQGINDWKQWRPVREAWSHLQAAIATLPADNAPKIRQPTVSGHQREPAYH